MIQPKENNKGDVAGGSAQIGPAHARFWGVRGSIATPGPSTVQYGGNTACVEVRVGNEIIILDAGTGLRPLGRALAKEFRGQPLNISLLLTHTHWDHIQGLPFFDPIYRPGNDIRIYGYEGARSSLVQILSGQMESPFFPVTLNELPGSVKIEELKELSFQIGDVRVEACFMNHPGVCVGYRIFTEERSLVYIPDNEPLFRHSVETSFWVNSAMSTSGADVELAKFRRFVQGADVLILDAQYDLEEYRRHVGWGHGCVDDALNIAMTAGVKQLFLFHHDPDHDDVKVDAMVAHGRKLAAQRGAVLQVEAATEGNVVQLAAVSGQGK